MPVVTGGSQLTSLRGQLVSMVTTIVYMESTHVITTLLVNLCMKGRFTQNKQVNIMNLIFLRFKIAFKMAGYLCKAQTIPKCYSKLIFVLIFEIIEQTF